MYPACFHHGVSCGTDVPTHLNTVPYEPTSTNENND